MKIVFVVNVDWFFLSHRLPLAVAAMERGWEVFLITKNTGKFDALNELGIKCIPLDFERSGKNPLKELSLIFKLKSIYKELKPNIIHHVTLKPSIYGTIAAKGLEKNTKIINAVSGLGYSFTDNRKSIGKIILIQLLKWAFRDKISNFIFQNPDDRQTYDELGFLTERNSIIIKGSGVDENEFAYTVPIEKEVLRVILLARMLKDKGILEFIAAANLLKEKYHQKVKFMLIGGIDLENPAHIKAEELQLLCDQDYIDWRGHQTNVKEIYQQSDITCLPSYREGLPKSLVEAMAVGRPIVTTNAIGCKECVDDGFNGYLVPIKSVNELAASLEKLIINKDLRLEMGIKSREKMVNEMSLSHVVSSTFKFYEA